METLAELAKMDGVVLAFEFAPDGRLLAHEVAAATPPAAAEMAAQFCASVTMSSTRSLAHSRN